jgi:hypothetical protein
MGGEGVREDGKAVFDKKLLMVTEVALVAYHSCR